MTGWRPRVPVLRYFMNPIPEKLVEETWQEVAGFDTIYAKQEMVKIGERQPNLMAFMMEFTEELDPEVRELAVYMFFVVYRIFQKSCTGKIRKIPAKTVISCYESNEDLMARLEGTHARFIERIAKVQLARQPYVMRYVVETLFEGSPEEEDPIDLSEEDTGFLFLLLKTMVDVLDRTVKR
jgi:hypothetical protein